MERLTKIVILISLMSFQNFIVKAQVNLVPNPSFEEYDSCPRFLDDFSAKDWFNPTIASPDYYNGCNTFNSGVPMNELGNQYARTGIAYTGIIQSYNESPTSYREYIQCKLKNELKPNKEYQVAFYVSLADSSIRACDNIGAYFSETSVFSLDNTNLIFSPQVISEESKPIRDKIDWVKIDGVFVAIGGEQYLTIGIFSDNANTNFLDVPNGWCNEPYYYIDDVSVIEIERIVFEMPSAFSPNGDNINDTYNPVYFDSSLKVNEFRIYNMWGEIVHNDPLVPWDGTYKGQPQPSSVYSYYVYIDFPVPDNISQIKSYHKAGSFTLLR